MRRAYSTHGFNEICLKLYNTVTEPERKTPNEGAGSRREIFQGKLCKQGIITWI